MGRNKKYSDETLKTTYAEQGSYAKTAKALDMNVRSVERRFQAMARQGWSPAHDMVHTVPDGFHVKGTSTLYKDGAAVLQWVKSSIDHERQAEIMQAAIEAMADELPRCAPVPAPASANPLLCNLYTLSDAHIGGMAWHREGGADWDLKIAEKTIVQCFQVMMDGAPDAKTCVINQLGDWMHFDSLESVTPTSRNLLDADGRFGKVVASAIRILRRVVEMALERHESVTLIVAEGNHDLASSVWLRKMFAALYEDEPRLSVNDSELPYYVHQHGNTMLAFHHGHIKKSDQLPLLFAAGYPLIWGSTTKRYCHVGHRHHTEVKEHSGMTVTQHPTLDARDAHASRGGWISERQSIGMTYHSEYGHVATNMVTPEMLQ